MEINITLFIQMVQFFIAYWFLRRYIFVPAYAIIHREDRAAQKLEGKISMLQSSMNEQRDQNQKDWGKIQKKLLSTVSKEVKEPQKQVDLDDLDLYNTACELRDDAVEEGTQFLREHIVKVDKVES
jgi:hypothetical protein